MHISDYVDRKTSEPLADFIQYSTSCSESDRNALRDIFDSLFANLTPEFTLQPLSDRDVVLVNNIRDLLRANQWTDGKIVVSDFQTSICTPSNGCLAGPFGNSPSEWLNLVVNLLILKTRRTSVICAIKDEGPWLLEWISHYKALGVENIIIYYNDCTDGSAELLLSLARANEIVAIENIVEPGISPQRQAFAHALSILRLPHVADWVSFLDSDEFLTADPPLDTIDEMIKAVQLESSEDRIDCIAVNWDWFADPDQFVWEKGLVVDRFHTAFKHDMKKCIFRPELATSIWEIHFPFLLEGSNSVDSSGILIKDLKEDIPSQESTLLHLNHYFAKSFQEFVLKKLRGRGARAAGTEIRPFDAFLWASVGTKPRTMNTKLRAELTKEMERLLAIPGIQELNELTQQRARDRLVKMGAEHDLKTLFEQVRRDAEAARRERQLIGRKD